jgi:hypothetical protein
MHDDLRQRDLSGKRVQDMSKAERQEMKRRFEEFVTMMKGRSAAEPAEAPAEKPKAWDPRAFGAKSMRGRAGN